MSEDLLQDLLDKLSSGDTAAAAQVFVTYAPYLRKVIRRQLPPGMRAKLDSSDVLQSAWGDILEGLQNQHWQFNSPAQLQAFLVRVMRNRCIDRCRQFRRPLESEQSLEDCDPAGLPPSARPSPGEVMQADELWERMLRLCPPEHHEVLRLKREGLSNQEIAARTGLHDGSIRRILRHLASRMASEQADALPPEDDPSP